MNLVHLALQSFDPLEIIHCNQHGMRGKKSLHSSLHYLKTEKLHQEKNVIFYIYVYDHTQVLSASLHSLFSVQIGISLT